MSRLALTRFPALPASVSELIRLAPEDPSYYERVLELCRSDPGLASELIRLAHSVAMATREHVETVHQALLLVGPRPAVNHLIGGALVRVFVPHAPVVKRMWERNVQIANAASHLATDVVSGALDSQVAHGAALLHNLGQLAMACVDQNAMITIIEESAGDPKRQLELESALEAANERVKTLKASKASALATAAKLQEEADRIARKTAFDNQIAGRKTEELSKRLAAQEERTRESERVREALAAQLAEARKELKEQGRRLSQDFVAAAAEDKVQAEADAREEVIGLLPLFVGS